MTEKRENKVLSLQDLLSPLATEITSRCELTAEEAAVVLENARQKKERELEHEAKLERRRLWEETMRRPWSAKELGMYVEWVSHRDGKLFNIDADNHKVIKQLCWYFSGDKAFETSVPGLSLEKGILLCGAVGRGKTHIMEAFRGNQKRSFKVVTCRSIADQFADIGEHVLAHWSSPIAVPTHYDTFYQNQIGTCFDDLGTEETKKHYGASVNVMGEILMNIYDRRSVPFHWIHATTNLTAEEIEERYGTRVRSRMREMFNMLKLGGEDRRK